MMKIDLQDFHGESVHPPNVSVENKVIHALPIFAVLFDWSRHDDAVQNAVHVWIIRVWFHQKWSPIEFDCSIVVLQNCTNQECPKLGIKVSIMSLFCMEKVAIMLHFLASCMPTCHQILGEERDELGNIFTCNASNSWSIFNLVYKKQSKRGTNFNSWLLFWWSFCSLWGNI